MTSMSLGRVFFRDTGETVNGKKMYVLVGKLWVPAETEIKGEHVYTIVGSELAIEGQGSVQFQMMLNGSLDIAEAARKKDPNRILPLIISPY